MLTKQYLKNKPVCKVTFTLPKEAAEGAQEVRILGDFNGWSWEKGTPMKAGRKEYKATLELETGKTYQFRYMIDQQRWENDHAADAYAPNEFGEENSVVIIAATPAPEKKATTTKKAPAPAKKESKTPAKKTAKAPSRKAATTPAPKGATPKRAPSGKIVPPADDLKRIEGIGPKIEKLFHDAGITTYAGLAKASKATLTGILSSAGPRFSMHDPGTWKQQAKLADKGEWEKLAKLQDELKGGKKK